ncbi:MAG: diguanylate cyclase [Candidatus Omnitrophica bacterium]|nr:diguanylate cyclase [Candidatus Omnitrophota bacterium]
MAKKRRSKNKKKRNIVSEYARLQRKVKELSSKDPLTGLYNYQYFTERLDAELKNAKRYVFPISIIMIDIDYFKSINDIYGYRTGNRLLKEFSHYLNKFARTSDVIARFSGAEFALLSPHTNKGGAIALGQRLCSKIQKRVFDTQKNNIKLRVSIGVVNYPEDGINTVGGLIDAGDSAIGAAKDRGGNVICTHDIITKKKIEPIPLGKEDIKDLRTRLQGAGKKLDQALLESIYAFAKAIEARDHYTGEHAEEMATIVREIAKEMGLSKKSIRNLEHAAVLHDLGKIGIDDKILRKKGKLTKKEYEQIKKHPVIGAEILRSVHFLRDVVPMILYHHERFDGKGYTSGLRGNEIPLGARILAIADVYQALMSDRPYRKAFTKKEAVKIIKESSGRQFDPDIVGALFKCIKSKKSRKKKL